MVFPCESCGRAVPDCTRIHCEGRLTFIEINRLSFVTRRKVKALIDFKDFDLLSCILHLNLRKFHLLLIRHYFYLDWLARFSLFFHTYKLNWQVLILSIF